MAGDGDTGVLPGQTLKFLGDTVGYRGVLALLFLTAAGLLIELYVVDRNCTLSAGNDGESAPPATSEFEHFSHFSNIVGDLGDQNDISAATDAGMERQPAGIPAHELHHKDPPVRAGCGVKVIDDVGGNVHGTL